MPFQPQTPDFEARVRESFDQPFLRWMEAELLRVEPGIVDVRLSLRDDFKQQDGYLHAGVTTTLVDTACGYAALTLMDAQSRVLSVEFKVNLMRPAVGEFFIAEGRVIKPGRTITVTEGKVFAHTGDTHKLIASMQATMIAVRD